MNHIMLDIETWSSGPTAVITAIGAVEFNPKTFEIGKDFLRYVDPQSCVDKGLHIDPKTIIWWLEQSEQARRQFKSKGGPIGSVLALFTDWLYSCSNKQDLRVWGNGSDFDNVIVANAYKVCGLELPWRYNHNCCYRTLKNLYKEKVPLPEFSGVKHNAVDDAKHQAIHCMSILGLFERVEKLNS